MEERFRIDGPRFEIARGTKDYPDVFEAVPEPPERLYVIGDPSALKEGLAVVGARKATPYGNHLLKLRALLRVPAGNTLSKDKVSGNNHVILLGIIQQKTFLRIRRKFCLVLCRDADVKTCHFTAHKYHLGFIKYVILSIKITDTQTF